MCCWTKDHRLTVAVLGLLEATEGHLGARNVLLGVLEVLEESVLVPVDTLLLVGVGVGEALDLTGLTAEQTVKVGPNLVGLALTEGVALGTPGLIISALCSASASGCVAEV